MRKETKIPIIIGNIPREPLLFLNFFEKNFLNFSEVVGLNTTLGFSLSFWSWLSI